MLGARPTGNLRSVALASEAEEDEEYCYLHAMVGLVVVVIMNGVVVVAYWYTRPDGVPHSVQP